jgi:hypothetical protein
MYFTKRGKKGDIMKRQITLFILALSMSVIAVACGGSSGGGGGPAVVETWSGTDSYGLIAFTLYDNGTFSAKGTITGSGNRSAYGTYTEVSSTITGSFSTSSSCTGPFSASVSGNTMSGNYSDNCGRASSFSASLATAQTYTWQLDGNGFLQFITSDPQDYNWGRWSYLSGSNQTQMSTVTATIKKQSGSAGSGYGIIFCYQDTNNFYRLLIETHGYFILSRKVGGVYTTIIPWTISANLDTGYGVENVVSVVQTSLYNFSIFFNGVQERTFTDYSFFGGRAGFYASVHDQTDEYFPGLPADIRFRLSMPISYP